MKPVFGCLLIAFSTAACTVPVADDSCPCSDDTNTEVLVDREIQRKLSAGIAKLAREKATVEITELMGQLDRSTCKLTVLTPEAIELSPKQIHDRYRAATIIVAKRYKCDHCPRWHLSTATGFFVTETGAFVTSAHVVNGKDGDSMAIMTSEGTVHAVESVLASSKEDDFAILQSQLAISTAAPLRAEADIGAPVTVISHPATNFYSLTTGVVSRYLERTDSKRGEARLMAITADFARGSSGGPVFDATGAVVGMVRATRSIYYEPKKQRSLQLVFKHCVTGKAIQATITH